MNQELPAIYEHGVLRPLTPLDLPEATRVILTLRQTSDGEQRAGSGDPLLGLMSDEADLVDQVVDMASSTMSLSAKQTKSTMYAPIAVCRRNFRPRRF